MKLTFKQIETDIESVLTHINANNAASDEVYDMLCQIMNKIDDEIRPEQYKRPSPEADEHSNGGLY